MRRSLLYSWLSYRALFFWASPRAYIASLLVLPASLGILFVIVNRSVGESGTRPILGASLLATGNAVMYGTALVIMEERSQGTLDLWFAAPVGILRSLLMKSIVHLGNGLLAGILNFVGMVLLFGVRPPAAAAWQLPVCALAVSISAAGIGIVTASVGIWSRDSLAAPNAMRSIILVLSGAVVNVGALAPPLRAVGWFFPVRSAVMAGQAVLDGHGLDFRLVLTEVLVGCGWGVVGYVFIHHAVVLVRRHGRTSLAN